MEEKENITSSENTNGQTINIHQQENKSNGIGTAGFVLSLIGLFFGWIPILGWVIWFLGGALSFAGLFKNPKGLAIGGLVISLISVIVLVFFAAALGLAAAAI